MGNSKAKRKGSPRAAPSTLSVREAPTCSSPVLEQPIAMFSSRCWGRGLVNKLLACNCAALPRQSFQLLSLSASRLLAHSEGGGGTLKLLELAGVLDTSVTLTLQWKLPSRRASGQNLRSIQCDLSWKALHGKLCHSLLAPQTNPNIKLQHGQRLVRSGCCHTCEAASVSSALPPMPAAPLIIQEGILSTWLPESYPQTLPHRLGGGGGIPCEWDVLSPRFGHMGQGPCSWIMDDRSPECLWSSLTSRSQAPGGPENRGDVTTSSGPPGVYMETKTQGLSMSQV